MVNGKVITTVEDALSTELLNLRPGTEYRVALWLVGILFFNYYEILNNNTNL